ncbi:YihY/virulence factor BrkB family protein [Parasulfitobacter algicola]|uniref:YihY/virulence factor BrkB family protein n=1 Tax=Parasulfitobacter algicola TaxID=2614809 RepID=A0ABX2IRV0_9RHOB|nr:YihY/virulence factor BrkB family protein [Sulfitobacter algicola]NSX55623.1 YihY/virulence factor BrkB family protein [Sulfitobacter algicola]
MLRLFRHSPTSLWRVLRGVWDDIDEKNLSLISAGVAFFGILAVFPGIAAVIAILGIWADPTVVNVQMELLRGWIPADAFRLLNNQVTTLISARTETLSWATTVSILIAFWSARTGVSALIRGMNSIYAVPNRPTARHYASALILTGALIGVAVVALATVVVAPIVLAFLPPGAWIAQTLDGLRWVVAISVVLAGLGIVYRYGPNHRQFRMPWVTPGAFLVVIMWAGASYGFSEYLANFGRYNQIYGSLGAVIALLMWLYISAFLILLGAALNVRLAQFEP